MGMEFGQVGRETSIETLQTLQNLYDAIYWEHGEGSAEDINHVLLHLAKLAGKVATPLEASEHGAELSTNQIQSEVIPDLLFWALHMANSFGVNIEEAYKKRLEGNIARHFQDQFNSLKDRWTQETAHLSNIIVAISHPAYREIVGMGLVAVPLILDDLRDAPQTGHWFHALREIVGEDAAENETKIMDARDKWLRWGEDHGFINSQP